jgi:acyl-CoA dehydrogenase
MCVQMSIDFARKRKTFGKRLVDHQVIQHKVAEMVRQTEMLQAQLEAFTYQMQTGANQKNLGRYSALMKVRVSV